MTAPHEPDRQKRSRGRRVYSMPDENLERLFAIVTALSGEVAALRERIDTHERLGASGVALSVAAVEDFVPDEAAERERDRIRQSYIARVFRILARHAAELRGRQEATSRRRNARQEEPS